MPIFTLPEMKQFKRQMVQGIIQDLQAELNLDKHKWTVARKLIMEFDINMETAENFQKSRQFRGSKSPRKLCERMRFVFLAESFLNTQLRLVLIDNMTESDRNDIKHLITQQFHELLALDADRTRALRARFQKLTNFRKLADNQYQLHQTYFEAVIARPGKPAGVTEFSVSISFTFVLFSRKYDFKR